MYFQLLKFGCVTSNGHDILISTSTTRVVELELKHQTPSFPKFPTPSHKVNEVWLLTILQQLAINVNCGAQQEISVSTKVSKEIVPLQQDFTT